MLRNHPDLGRRPGDPAAFDRPVDVRTGSGADFAPPALGTVYGVLANYRGFVEALGDAVNTAPYKAPPKAPVLYLKPRNTVIGAGMPIPVPDGVPALEVGACLGIVIGQTACRVRESEAHGVVAGYTIVNDVSVPHTNYFRPAVRFKCRDGFCPVGPWIVGARHVPEPDRLSIRVTVEDRVVQVASTADLVRPVARLLADVTEFMTLSPGDVLLVGVPPGAPHAAPGQRVAIEIDGIGRLENPLIAESVLASDLA